MHPVRTTDQQSSRCREEAASRALNRRAALTVAAGVIAGGAWIGTHDSGDSGDSGDDSSRRSAGRSAHSS